MTRVRMQWGWGIALGAVIAWAAACGGKVSSEAGDGGEQSGSSGVARSPDAGRAPPTPTPGNPPAPPPSTTPPTPVACGPHSGGGSGSASSCTASDTSQCAGTTYEVTCACPEARCICQANGLTTAVLTYASCPTCGTSFRALYQQCGFPY